MEEIKQATSETEKKSEVKEGSNTLEKNKKQFIKANSSNIKPFEKKSAPGNKKSFSKDGTSSSGGNRPAKISKQSVTGYEEKIVGVKKISKTTKGGRNMRFSALAVIGDRKGNVGFGLGKSIEVPVAIRKALKSAKNNMYKIKMNKNFTLYHEVVGKHGAGKVLIKPAPKGTGVIAGGPIKVVLELCGFKDVYSKNLGRNTSLNMVRATIKGLQMQKSPKEYAALRDKQLKEIWE
ncbi:MAG: 30S ribosomal protein S5 [Malacoplasma sp.]|nr:30S ribosomal protein S5 [Malacoplasma sp.]MDE5775001.1 30S ribosomal protein S5 [Malacoplasma sp.]MDE7099658.1 30S ribosomal protein S5 [Malacoplasma sp.]